MQIPMVVQRRVRVVEMQPRKEAAAANLAQPAKRIVNGTVRRASKRFAIDRPG